MLNSKTMLNNLSYVLTIAHTVYRFRGKFTADLEALLADVVHELNTKTGDWYELLQRAEELAEEAFNACGFIYPGWGEPKPQDDYNFILNYYEELFENQKTKKKPN